MSAETAENKSETPSPKSLKAKVEEFKQEIVSKVDKDLMAQFPKEMIAHYLLDDLLHESPTMKFFMVGICAGLGSGPEELESFQKDATLFLNASLTKLWGKCFEWGAVKEPVPEEFRRFIDEEAAKLGKPSPDA